MSQPQEANTGLFSVDSYKVGEQDGRFVAWIFLNGKEVQVPAEIGSGTYYDKNRGVLVMTPAVDD